MNVSLQIDPKIIGILFGSILFFTSFIISDKTDEGKSLVIKIGDLNHEFNACKEDIECKTSVQNVLNDVRTDLETIQRYSNMKWMYFVVGLLILAGFSGVMLTKY
jgi:hypothetical protein